MAQVVDKSTKDEGFNFIPAQNIEQQMQPTEQSRLLAKDIKREENLPTIITAGAKKTGIAQIPFYANAGSGNFTTSVTLGLPYPPLVLVWHLGSIDKTGYKIEGGGLVNGGFNSTSSIVDGYTVFSGAHSSYTVTKSTLTIGITSTNVGWAPAINAYYKYAVYYDDIGSELTALGVTL